MKGARLLIERNHKISDERFNKSYADTRARTDRVRGGGEPLIGFLFQWQMFPRMFQNF